MVSVTAAISVVIKSLNLAVSKSPGPIVSTPSHGLRLSHSYSLQVSKSPSLGRRLSYLLFILLISMPVLASPTDIDTEADAVLDAADGFFKAMKAKQYVAIWDGLSAKSRSTIVDDVGKAIKKAGLSVPPADEIEKDFRQGGTICQAYWNGILEDFSPDMLLKQAIWEMGPIKKDRAEVHIQYKKAQRPVLLRMYRESSRWKVGLVETFWGLRRW